MSPSPIVLSVLLLTGAGTAVGQQAVVLRLGGVVGSAVHSRVVLNAFMRGGPTSALGGDATLPTMRLTMNVTQTLESVVGDTLTFSSSVDSVVAESPAMPQAAKTLQASLPELRRSSSVRMDSRGHVLANDSAAAGELPGGFGPSEHAFGFPATAVRVGESWADSLPPLPEAKGTPVRSRRSLSLVRIEPRGDSGTAIITMSGTVAVVAGEEVREVPFAGVMAFDLAAHRVTGLALTTMYEVGSAEGGVSARMELSQTEPGDTALTVPLLRHASGAAAAAEEPVGTDISPAPARFTVVRLGAPADSQLNALLAEQARRARAAGRRPFVEFEAAWCGPCQSLKRSLGNGRMVEAFAGTYIVRVDLDSWQAHLAGTGFDVPSIPAFFELGDDGRPTGRRIDGGAWGEDIPENMAPPLKAFFRPLRP
jgi:hypothetical protein